MIEQAHSEATPSTYAGLFFLSLAVLAYELLLTRILSVTMFYHFAFMVVSTAMFGLTIGSMSLYVFPELKKNIFKKMSWLSIGTAISIVVSLLAHINFPITGQPFQIAISSLCTYFGFSIPFILSGIVFALLFSAFDKRIGSLYAADLGGAAAGCFALVLSFNIFDGFTETLFTAFFACVASLCFARRLKPAEKRIPLVLLILFAGSVLLHSYLFNNHLPGRILITWAKGNSVLNPIYEQWNSFSRITIWGNPEKPYYEADPGMSIKTTLEYPVQGLNLEIDGLARTRIVEFDGNLSKLAFLKYNVSNIAYKLKKDPRVLIIGTGGGYDVASALALGAKSVLGVEINGNILNAVNKRFGNFSGHLNTLKNVRFVNDEARGFISRTNELYDIIEMSLIDTWAATANGAYVLTENSLYTVESWQIFLGHLAPDGIFSVSRWYERKTPAEMYRLTSLAADSLRRLHISNPRKHIVIVRNLRQNDNSGASGIGTLLVSRSSFSANSLIELKEFCRSMNFEIILDPENCADPMFAALCDEQDPQPIYNRFPTDISPATDDKPFFFNMLRLQNIFDPNFNEKFIYNSNLKAVSGLFSLLLSSFGLFYICLCLPLRFAREKIDLSQGHVLRSLYFLSIGIGFMFVEIAQIQKCIVFLGHPIYGITVVLFTLLFSSGIGSLFTGKFHATTTAKKMSAHLALLPTILLITGIAAPGLLIELRPASLIIKIFAVVAYLFATGFFMGSAFPLGIKALAARQKNLIPFFWGVNGAGSVFGSILAALISIFAGINILYWSGTVFYVAAFLIFAGLGHKEQSKI